MSQPLDKTTLWLARALFDAGAIQFGNFTLGRTAVNSPVYVNPRLLISEPAVLRQVAKILEREVQAGQTRRRPRVSRFDLIAGVPMGGLHLATALMLLIDVPMIYVRPPTADGGEPSIEGRLSPGQTVLLIDDLVTGGGSLLDTARRLESAGLIVKDAVALVDREEGAAERLHQHGYNLISILRLRTMLNYYVNEGLVERQWYERSIAYLDRTDRQPAE
jgi:orotate phosphoribosyltransferase